MLDNVPQDYSVYGAQDPSYGPGEFCSMVYWPTGLEQDATTTSCDVTGLGYPPNKCCADQVCCWLGIRYVHRMWAFSQHLQFAW